MKKIFFLFFGLIFSFSLIFGQTMEQDKEMIKQTKEKIKQIEEELKVEKAKLKKLDGPNVSNRSKNNFVTDFGDIDDVMWKKNDMYDVATFTIDGLKKSAFYDFNSELIGTTWSVPFSDLPERAQKEINKEYKDYTIGPVIYYDDNEPVDVNFFFNDTQFEHEDSYFVELIKDTKKIILRINSSGDVYFFKRMK